MAIQEKREKKLNLGTTQTLKEGLKRT